MESEKIILDSVTEEVLKAFEKLGGNELLILNRALDASFFDIFADSMFHYKKGVLLIERFFKKNSCLIKELPIKVMRDSDKEVLMELESISKSMPDIKSISEEEIQNLTDKINELKSVAEKIKPDIKLVETYTFNNMKLTEFDLIDKVNSNLIAEFYANSFTLLLSSLSWNFLNKNEIIIKTIEYDDYIDLVIFPIK